MVVFGGRIPSTQVSDLWTLSLSGTPTWARLIPSETGPSAREGHTAVYDSANQRMIIFGGRYIDDLYNDVWALSLGTTPAWTQLAPGSGPSVRWGHSLLYDAADGRMIVFGGSTEHWSSAFSLDEVWTLSLADPPAWAQLPHESTWPSARMGHSAIYDADQQRMVVFGGAYAGESFRNDVWALGLARMPPPTISGRVTVLDMSTPAAKTEPLRDMRIELFRDGIRVQDPKTTSGGDGSDAGTYSFG